MKITYRKSTAYSIIINLLAAIGVFLILWGLGFWGLNPLTVNIIAALVIILFLPPLRGLIEAGVDRYFARARYDYQRILGRFSIALTRPVTALGKYAKMASYLLYKSMNLAACSVMVLDRESQALVVQAGEGEAEKMVGLKIAEDSALIKELTVHYAEIDRATIADRLGKEGLLAPGEKERLIAVLGEMDKLQAVLIIPSVSESDYFTQPTLLATINLGRKLSGDPYTPEDIQFLKTMANQSAISVEHTFILEELKKKQEQVVRSEKLAALGSTIAGVAHELKNPLTYLLTVAQSMAGNWDKPAFRESVVNMLPSEVERMKLIIEGLSDYSKTHELRLEPVEVAAVIDKVLLILGYEIGRNKIFIKKNYTVGGEEKVLARADKNRLVQVFMNIISNAIQAIGPEGGDVSLTIHPEESEVRISINDTGPGIPHEKLQRIFDPFFTTKESGTGLGLSITKKIIEEHNGSIYIDSYIGEGTTFTICLPRA
jgi:signal transduction histidine kinase